MEADEKIAEKFIVINRSGKHRYIIKKTTFVEILWIEVLRGKKEKKRWTKVNRLKKRG